MVRIPFCISTNDGRSFYYCGHCKQYRHVVEFYPCSIRRNDRRCQNCVRRINQSLQQERTKNDPCRLLLRRSRRLAYQCNVRCALDLTDVHLLVKDIWDWQSAMSPGSAHRPEELVLAPWHLNRPLTPWNAVLLTRQEARQRVRRAPMPSLASKQDYINSILCSVQKKYPHLKELPPKAFA